MLFLSSLFIFQKRNQQKKISDYGIMLKKAKFSESPYFGLHDNFFIMVINKLKVDIFNR